MHEVTVGGEVGGRVTINREHAVFLFGGALDALKGGVESFRSGAGFEGGLLGVVRFASGGGGTAVSLGGKIAVAGDEGAINVPRGKDWLVCLCGAEYGFGERDVFKLFLVEVAAAGDSLGCGGDGGSDGRGVVWHIGLVWLWLCAM